jgi:hypothetical protein
MPSQEAAELVSLSWVACVAYEALVAPKPHADASRRELLELLALGISLHAPIYAVGEEGGLRRLEPIELASGHFTAAAARFEFHDGRPALKDLRIKICDLPMTVRTVAALQSPPRSDGTVAPS